jgi:hypothetical protein
MAEFYLRAVEVRRDTNVKEVSFTVKRCRADLGKERNEDICFERKARRQARRPRKTLIDGIEATVNPTWSSTTLFRKTADEVILDKNATIACGVVDANYGHRERASRRSVEPGQRRQIRIKIGITVHNED